MTPIFAASKHKTQESRGEGVWFDQESHTPKEALLGSKRISLLGGVQHKLLSSLGLKTRDCQMSNWVGRQRGPNMAEDDEDEGRTLWVAGGGEDGELRELGGAEEGVVGLDCEEEGGGELVPVN